MNSVMAPVGTFVYCNFEDQDMADEPQDDEEGDDQWNKWERHAERERKPAPVKPLHRLGRIAPDYGKLRGKCITSARSGSSLAARHGKQIPSCVGMYTPTEDFHPNRVSDAATSAGMYGGSELQLVPPLMPVPIKGEEAVPT
eukprot:3326652-Amphidinium_carterae.1